MPHTMAGDDARPLPLSILTRLLEAAGYRLESRPAGLRASRSSDHRTLLIASGAPSPTDLESEFPTGSVRRTLVYVDDPGPAARTAAAELGIEILDAQTLGPALGELLLPGSAPPGEPALATDRLEPPPTAFPDGVRTVRPRLTREEAVRRAGFDSGRVILRLVPHYVAAYRVRPPTAGGGATAALTRWVSVDGLSGRVDVWNPGERELMPDAELAADRYEPMLEAEEALRRAEVELRRRHSVSVDHVEQHGGAIVVERRRVPPASDDLRLGTPTILFVPYWFLESPAGRVVVDAVTGAPVVPVG